ncbi:MAG: ribonuclease H-like domain-containing protein, partial [Promethearchaeota archaeon]
MIEHFFQFLKGIGPKTELQLHSSGIETWNDAFRLEKPTSISSRNWNILQDQLPSVKAALNTKNISEIHELIDKTFHWPLIPQFIGDIAYLDIETTGFSYPRSHITTIAVWDGKKVHDFIRYDNLDDFPEFISKFPAIATFYGKGFDIPFIRAELGAPMNQIHFDLCFLLKKLGISGGLKRIEHYFGLSRGEIEGVTGATAVKLWRKYRKTDDLRYLHTLLAYNNEDVFNLEFLL